MTKLALFVIFTTACCTPTSYGHDPGVVDVYGQGTIGALRSDICAQLAFFTCDTDCYTTSDAWDVCRVDAQRECMRNGETIVAAPVSAGWPFTACAEALAAGTCAHPSARITKTPVCWPLIGNGGM